MVESIRIYSLGSIERRTSRVRWLLEEIGLNYAEKALDFYKREHKESEYLKVNPMGTAPAVECEGRVLIESGAICTYFADKYPEKKMAPTIDSPDRGEYLQWIFFAYTMESILADAFKASGTSEEEKKVAEATKNFAPVVQILEKTLVDRKYLVGNTFSAADIMVSSTLHWAEQFGIQIGENLTVYVENLKSRETARKAETFLPIFDS